MEKEVRCTKCQKPFEAVGQGTLADSARAVFCPYCNEQNEVMWPTDGLLVAQGIQQFLEAEQLRQRTQTQAAGRLTTLPNQEERQSLVNEAENFLKDAVGLDGLIVPVDPSDLKNVWKKQLEIMAQSPGQQVMIGREIFSQGCTSGANVTAVWYRVGILQMLDKSLELLPANIPTEVEDAVFRVVARFPIKPMEAGVVYEGLPLDAEAFVKQLGQELIGR